ncbi:MAG: hypothetical protein HFI74_07665 [Lachnospiraceae bacterium]|nr:hypothetical protein [Lachnospiraceae bacterium]
MNIYQNHTCLICGKTYRACHTCDNIRSFQPWRTITDTRNCYKIFLILNSYSNGHASLTSAKQQLQNCNLSQFDFFLPHIQDTIRNILEKEELVDVP